MEPVDERPEVYVFLDESGTSRGDGMTLVGATAFSDVAAAEHAIEHVFSRALGDASLWSKEARRRRFASTGFHFTDDSESVRQLFLSTLRSIDFRSYAAYSRNDPSTSTTGLLIGMYGTLLRSVLARYRNHNLKIVFEQNSEMDPIYGQLWSALQCAVDGISDAEALIGTKAAPCLAVTDYMLGVTRASLQSEARDFERGRFKALGRTYAYLIDYDNDRHLGGTRRPIV